MAHQELDFTLSLGEPVGDIARGFEGWAEFGPAVTPVLVALFYGVFCAELLIAPAMSRLELKQVS